MTAPNHHPDYPRRHQQPVGRDLAAVRRFAASLLRPAAEVGLVPLAGDPAWCALPDHDPRKLAAVVRAGLAWLADCTPAAIAERLRAELDQAERDLTHRIRNTSHDLSAAADWRRIADHPTHTQLVARRAEPGRAAQSWRDQHHGEYQGGPVTWTSTARSETAAERTKRDVA